MKIAGWTIVPFTIQVTRTNGHEAHYAGVKFISPAGRERIGRLVWVKTLSGPDPVHLAETERTAQSIADSFMDQLFSAIPDRPIAEDMDEEEV